MPLGQPLEPGVELALLDLHNAVALGADEMVMVPLAAPAVAELSRVMGEGVDHSLLGEEPERPVDGRKPEALAPRPQAHVQLLRGDVVPLAHQLPQHGDALARRSHPGTRQEGGRLAGLLLRGHGGYASTR